MLKHGKKPRHALLYFSDTEVYAEYPFAKKVKRIVKPVAQYKEVLDRLKKDNVVLVYICGAFPRQETTMAQDFVLVHMQAVQEQTLISRMKDLIDDDKRSLDEKCEAKKMLEARVRKENRK